MELVRSSVSIDCGLPCVKARSAPAIVFSGPAQRLLTLWPARSRSRHATLSIESSDSFVASAAASIATGWSEPVPGRELHPLKSKRLSRRTLTSISGSCAVIRMRASEPATRGTRQTAPDPISLTSCLQLFSKTLLTPATARALMKQACLSLERGRCVGGLSRSTFQDRAPGGRMKKDVTRRDVIRVGSVVFASGAAGLLEALLSGCSAASNSSSTTSSSSSSSSSSCAQATNVTGRILWMTAPTPTSATTTWTPASPNGPTFVPTRKGQAESRAGFRSISISRLPITTAGPVLLVF